MNQPTHEAFMLECLQLARQALAGGNPPVGSLLVLGDKVISKGEEQARSTGDVTDHAEIIALRKGIHALSPDERAAATLYSTHEPCVLCAYAIRHYGIGRVVFGARVPYAGGYSSRYNLLSETGYPSWKVVPQIVEGILVEQCAALSKEYEDKKRLITAPDVHR